MIGATSCTAVPDLPLRDRIASFARKVSNRPLLRLRARGRRGRCNGLHCREQRAGRQGRGRSGPARQTKSTRALRETVLRGPNGERVRKRVPRINLPRGAALGCDMAAPRLNVGSKRSWSTNCRRSAKADFSPLERVSRTSI